MTRYAEQQYAELRAAVEALARKFGSEADWGRGLGDPTWSNCFASAEKQLRALLTPAPASETARGDASGRVADGQTWSGLRCELCGVVRMNAMESRDGVVRCQDWLICEQVVALVSGARSTYDDLIEAGWTPTPTPPTTVQADRDAGQVRLREPLLIQSARRMAAKDPGRDIRIINGTGTTVRGFVGEVDDWLAALAARQSDPDATERVEFSVRLGNAMTTPTLNPAMPADLKDHPDAVAYRRTVTTGEWTEVGGDE